MFWLTWSRKKLNDTWIFVFRLESKLPEGRGSVLSIMFFPKARVVVGIEYVLQVLAEWANNQKQDSGQSTTTPPRA